MDEWIRRDRANQYRVKRNHEGEDLGAARNRYARLMQVDIRHGYYAEAGETGACPDFRAAPTPPTRELMRSLGLLFLNESAGFSILYEPARAEGLYWYLRQHGTPPNGGKESQYWTRLSFVLSLKNLSFINFTEIPIDTNPTQQNFYFTNQDAHDLLDQAAPQVGPAILNKNKWVDGAALLPVEGPELRVRTPPDVKEVVVLDIAGQPVLAEFRCVPTQASPPTQVCRDVVFLDFTTLPEDKYVIEYVMQPGATPLLSRPILYTVAEPIPLCFIDLLFTKPSETADGVYPVGLYPEVDTNDDPHKAAAGNPETKSGAIRPVRYMLRFEARATYWRYYIVPQPQREELEDLAIEPVGDTPPVSFSGPTRVRLATGALAYRFVSNDRLLLRQHSSYRFRLRGWTRRAPASDDILVACLPVASSKQVLPEGGTAHPTETYSDIYVYI